MLRRTSAAIAATAVILSSLTFSAAPASATNTRPTDATYGASAAVDVQRTPAYPACTGTTFNSWSVESSGNPISQSAYNDTGSLTTGRVDLASVSYWDGTATQVTPAVLKVIDLGTGTPREFALEMYIAPAGTTELLWDTATNRWALSAAGGDDSFATTGNAYALYSGGFMHEGVGPGALFEIGTFLMIDDTLLTGETLVYTPSPVTDNVCSSSKTYATATGMASTTLGGSGSKIVPSDSTSTRPPPPPSPSLSILTAMAVPARRAQSRVIRVRGAPHLPRTSAPTEQNSWHFSQRVLPRLAERGISYPAAEFTSTSTTAFTPSGGPIRPQHLRMSWPLPA